MKLRMDPISIGAIIVAIAWGALVTLPAAQKVFQSVVMGQ